MDRSHRHGSLRNHKVGGYTKIHVDQSSDFASIKVAPGIESRSYVKNGVVVCEDSNGRVIEIQLLNLKSLLSTKGRLAA